jgi:Fe(3+) dicitrate transport protein
VGYLNTLSATQEFEVKAYYNELPPERADQRGQDADHLAAAQPVTGIEPRYTQRFTAAA